MTQDEIIRMARDAGLGWGEGLGGMPEFLDRFAALVAAHEREKQAEQEPIRFIWNGEGWIEADDYIWKTTDDYERRILYAAPVRTKDLTDDEVEALFWKWESETEYPVPLFEFRDIARFVIAADREKNK